MKCEDLDSLLDAFVDGETSTDDRRPIERHLASCPACRRVVEETRALAESASRLPRSIEPPRDLFAGIRQRVETARPASDTRPRGSGVRWISIAAAILVVAIAGLTTLWVRDASAPAEGQTGLPAAVIPASDDGSGGLDLAIREYVEVSDRLLGAIREREGRLSPETLETLEKNLAIIDRAIEEVRGVLEAEPGDPDNAFILAAMHQQKVELLRRVSRLAS